VTLPAFQFDDDINIAWNHSTKNNMTFFIKKGLLILDDPKYQNCPNLVSYLITDTTDPYYNMPMASTLFISVPVGRISRIILVNPNMVSSVTLNDPLPAGMTWTVFSIVGAFTDDGAAGPGATGAPVTAGAVLVWNPLTMHYDLMFDHVDAQGYTATVEGPNAPGTPGNFFFTLTNTCFYPDPTLVGPLTVCPGNALSTKTIKLPNKKLKTCIFNFFAN
jgi:hypothetical protein